MASWKCSVCGFSHGQFEQTCFGCHHPGTSLVHYIDCPSCGEETPADGEWCDACQAELEPDEDADLDGDFADDE